MYVGIYTRAYIYVYRAAAVRRCIRVVRGSFIFRGNAIPNAGARGGRSSSSAAIVPAGSRTKKYSISMYVVV